MKKNKEVLVLGGGTGTYTVLTGLKSYALDLTAGVPVSDTGGSTGMLLKDEFGPLPVGDARMALVALAESDEENEMLRKLLLYRFDKGNGLQGHNFGNLLLAALGEICGSQEKAFEEASKIFRVKGKVMSVSNERADLVAHYEDGSVIKGETHIDEPSSDHDGRQRITQLELDPSVSISPGLKEVAETADAIVLGPGDLYTSLIANLLVNGVPEAVQDCPMLIFNINLVAKWGQTFGFTAKDHVDELSRYLKRKPNYVLINNQPLPVTILKKYELENGYPVADDLGEGDGYTVVRADLLGSEEIKKPSGDVLVRSLIRHDSDKVAWEIFKLIKNRK